MPDNAVIEKDEMFVLTPDDLTPGISDDDARRRGDFPDPETLDKHVEVILPEDRETVEEDRGQVVDEPESVEPEASEAAESVEEESDIDIEDDGGRKQTPKSVPYGRFADKVAEADKLRDRIRELEAERVPPVKDEGQQQQAEDTKKFDLDAKYREHAALIGDGEVELAASVMAEIDAYKEQQVTERVIRNLKQHEIKVKAQDKVGQILNDHQDFFADPVNLDIFDAAKQSYMRLGYPLDKALEMAEKRFFGEQSATPFEKSTAEVVDDEKQALDKVRQEQKKTSIKKGAATMSSQPPAMNGGQGMKSIPSSKKNAFEMTAEEKRSMTSRERAIARGDIVE